MDEKCILVGAENVENLDVNIKLIAIKVMTLSEWGSLIDILDIKML